MLKLKFKVPNEPRIQQKLYEFKRIFERAKEDIQDAIVRNRAIANTTALENSVWADLVSVVSGARKPPEGLPEDWTFCSLHREKPRWGAPLFDISADEVRNVVTLRMRFASEPDSDVSNDMGLIFESLEPYSDLERQWSMIESSSGVDYWVVLNDGVLITFLMKY